MPSNAKNSKVQFDTNQGFPTTEQLLGFVPSIWNPSQEILNKHQVETKAEPCNINTFSINVQKYINNCPVTPNWSS